MLDQRSSPVVSIVIHSAQQYYPDVIPVGTLFVFGIVAFPQNVPVPGPPTTFRTGAVWSGVRSVPRDCGDEELAIPLTGFWNMSEEYSLQWQLEHGSLVNGPYAKPTDEASLTLKTGSKVTGAAVIRYVYPRSTPVR